MRLYCTYIYGWLFFSQRTESKLMKPPCCLHMCSVCLCVRTRKFSNQVPHFHETYHCCAILLTSTVSINSTASMQVYYLTLGFIIISSEWLEPNTYLSQIYILNVPAHYILKYCLYINSYKEYGGAKFWSYGWWISYGQNLYLGNKFFTDIPFSEITTLIAGD